MWVATFPFSISSWVCPKISWKRGRKIMRRIIDNPNDKGAWREMLHFGPTILAKPKRGGANRNLSNVIIKRVVAWDEKNRTTHSEQCLDRGYSKRTTDDSRLAAAITRKLEAGNFRAAIRLICSSESPAPINPETLQALRAKHPESVTDRRTTCDPKGHPLFAPLQISQDEVTKVLRTFPQGSSGGPDGITPQHIIDLLTGATDDSLIQSITDLSNLLLAGSFDNEINSIIYGGRLIALSKKDGGIRPIAVGYTLRRIAAKCANNHVIARRSQVLQPQQLGVGISGGAEAAVHAVRKLVQNLPPGHDIVKLDFSNAFNSIRRDLILDAIASKIPEIYCLVHAAFSCNPSLTFGEYLISSQEGAQQGDPLGSLEFCEAIHSLLLDLQSSVKLGFIDDLTLYGEWHTVEKDVSTITQASSVT